MGENNLPTLEEVLRNNYIVDVQTEHQSNIDWIILKLGSGVDVHIQDRGMVIVHNLTN